MHAWPALVCARRGIGAAPVVTLCLNDLGHLQHVAKALVVDDGALINFRQPVVGEVGQGCAIGAHLDTPIRIFVDLNIPTNRSARCGRVLQEIQALVILQRQIVRDPAWLTHCTDLVKEMRLLGISTMAAANLYAPVFMIDFNARFAKPPRNDFNANRPLREDEDLDLDGVSDLIRPRANDASDDCLVIVRTRGRVHSLWTFLTPTYSMAYSVSPLAWWRYVQSPLR